MLDVEALPSRAIQPQVGGKTQCDFKQCFGGGGDPDFNLLYAMGRVEEVWEEDCGEFMPKHDMVKYEPSNKFLAFDAGLRSFVGRDIALMHMMVVAAMMI
ncbi:Cytochrome P450 86A1 [Acorus calamus]|uniref:Cytochrome P450 86A1 n=1 Tax=Acorus calamus TaxID=4465 RepID=A0AAV9DGR9_ACOCL|nr:Cytochrome P450 86A1 [Acorus calamus]